MLLKIRLGVFLYLVSHQLAVFPIIFSALVKLLLNIFRSVNFLFCSRVVFPEVLNLNSFIPTATCLLENETIEDRETNVKCDDCSTTDSGSALDDESCQCNDISSTVNGPDDTTFPDDDEGILIYLPSLEKNCYS